MKEKFPLVPRKKDADKSRYGHVLVVAGSRGFTGAAVLASRAALTAGSGLVTLGIPESLAVAVLKKLPPEIMILALPETKNAALGFSAFGKISGFIRKRRIGVVAVGPGLSVDPETVKLVRKIVRTSPAPVVLDADGLNAFRSRANLFLKHRAPLVLTPHRKEFEHVFGERWPENGKARTALAKRLARFYEGVLVLKGHRTLVASGSRVYRNSTGNPGMAKGGSGDVLTGIIASFIGQGLDPFRAARWGVYFHGLAGDLAVKKTGELSLTASDLIGYLPRVFPKK